MTPSPDIATPVFAPVADRPLPARADVVVIGGGVVGVSAALALAERGVPVVLCEKGRIAGEQSSRNWGWIRKQGRDFAEMPLMLEAERLWHRYAAECGVEIGLRRNGIAYLAVDDAAMDRHTRWYDGAKAHQLDTRLLTAAEASAHAHQPAGRFKGGILTPSDQHADPALAVPALADLAAQKGASLFEMTAVRGIDRSAGRVSGVVTEHGPIACDAVIFAGGVWTRPMLENMGFGFPQLAVRSMVTRTAPAPAIAAGPIGTSLASIRPRLDGGYTLARSSVARFDLTPAAFTHARAFWPTLRAQWRMLKIRAGRAEFFGPLGRQRWQLDQISPFEQVRMLDPAPDMSVIQRTLRSAAEVFPQLRGVQPLAHWAGMIDVMPDERPVIGALPGVDGVVLATGMSGHGFGLGPGAGRLAADLAVAAKPVVDPMPYTPNRLRHWGRHGHGGGRVT